MSAGTPLHRHSQRTSPSTRWLWLNPLGSNSTHWWVSQWELRCTGECLTRFFHLPGRFVGPFRFCSPGNRTSPSRCCNVCIVQMSMVFQLVAKYVLHKPGFMVQCWSPRELATGNPHGISQAVSARFMCSHAVTQDGFARPIATVQPEGSLAGCGLGRSVGPCSSYSRPCTSLDSVSNRRP